MRRISVTALVILALATVPAASAVAEGDRSASTSPPLRPLVRDVLPHSMRGESALHALDALRADALVAVATQNGQTVEHLTAILADDRTAWLDADGMLFFEDAPPPPADPGAAPSVSADPGGQTFLLHSRPGSSRVLYLDFDGYDLPTVNGWRAGAYTALPFDIDGSPTTWSRPELDTVQSIYLRVAEDYAPFDIDVTTQDPGAVAIARSSVGDDVFGGRVVVTNSPNSDICGSFCAGVSYVGTVDSVGVDHDLAQPSWVFSDTSKSSEYLANNASHEFGHAMGLSHDGNASRPEGYLEYDIGHGMWAPLMGWGFTQPISQWSRGEYTGATNLEDDFAVAVSNGVGLAADDAGGRSSPTDDLVPGRAQLIGATPVGDVDTWRYVAPCSGPFTFVANVAAVSPNLSLDLQLADRRGVVLADDRTQPLRVSLDAATGMGGSVTANLTKGAEYAVGVSPLANGTPATGWSNYGNVGRYSIAVTPSCALPVLVPGSFATSEGNTGRKIFRIPISLSAPTTDAVTVRFRALPVAGPGYATAGADYTPVRSGTVTFRSGETVKSVPVAVHGDTVDEPPLYLGEWFFVQFDAPSANARLDTSTFGGVGIGVIVDDD